MISTELTSNFSTSPSSGLGWKASDSSSESVDGISKSYTNSTSGCSHLPFLYDQVQYTYGNLSREIFKFIKRQNDVTRYAYWKK